VLASVGAKGNFQVELVSGYPDNDYTNNTQTWCYNVTVLAEKGDLSHWCLDLCDEPKHEVLSFSGPAEKIEYTAPTWDDGVHGHIIKWDGTTLKPEESAIFCFTLENIWESTDVDWFAKDGVHWDDTGKVTGPSCMPFCVPPIADFNADKNEACADDEVVFTDASAPDDITTWSWSFPGGNPSSADTQGPHTVTYNIPGTYTVSLAVTNVCGSYTETKTDYITAEDCTPVLELTINSTDGGSVNIPGEGVFTYDEGTVVNLVAVADSGYQFVNWTGGVDTIANIDDAATTITMESDYSITANFEAIPVIPPVTVGWETYPINKLAILAPWITLFTVIMVGASLLALKRRKT